MNPVDWWANASGPSLFVSAFLSATLLPGTSEALLAGLWLAKSQSALELWTWATSGNVLGSVLNREMGAGLARFRNSRWLQITEEQWRRAEQYFLRYGQWSLLLAWVPIVGDPLTIVAGALGVSRWRFLILVTLGKGLRYAGLLWLLKTGESTI